MQVRRQNLTTRDMMLDSKVSIKLQSLRQGEYIKDLRNYLSYDGIKAK